MTAEAVVRPTTDAAARGAREMTLAQIDKQFSEIKAQIESRRNAKIALVKAQMWRRVGLSMGGVHVTDDGVLHGDPESVRRTVALLSAEPIRLHGILSEIQATAEAEWADARANRDKLRAPFLFGGAKHRLHILSPNTAKEA